MRLPPKPIQIVKWPPEGAGLLSLSRSYRQIPNYRQKPLSIIVCREGNEETGEGMEFEGYNLSSHPPSEFSHNPSANFLSTADSGPPVCTPPLYSSSDLPPQENSLQLEAVGGEELSGSQKIAVGEGSRPKPTAAFQTLELSQRTVS